MQQALDIVADVPFVLEGGKRRLKVQPLGVYQCIRYPAYRAYPAYPVIMVP
jgi:hypothetical protein